MGVKTDANSLNGDDQTDATHAVTRAQIQLFLKQRNNVLAIFLIAIGGWTAIQQWQAYEPAPPSSTLQQNFVIDLNQATEAELKLLPGVGDKLAQDILRYRDDRGTIQSLDELTNIKGIKQGRLESLKKFLTVGSDPTEK